VNRALGTGTRVLLEELLAGAGLTPDQIGGFDRVEPSHAAIAQGIASGQADAGLGIEAAARARGLDFIRLVEEDYHLACLRSALEEPAVKILRALLMSPPWQQTLLGLPGYQAAQQSGVVQSLRRTLPWWRYRDSKQASQTKTTPKK